MPCACLRDPAAIHRRSFGLIRGKADFSRFPDDLGPIALSLARAAADMAILADLAWSEGVPILVANGVSFVGERTLVDWRARHGGALMRLAASRMEKLGAGEAWRPLLAVAQPAATKPG